jgi:hypothetical protein
LTKKRAIRLYAAKKAPIVPKVIRQPTKPMKIVVKAPREEAKDETMWKTAKADVCLFCGK